MKRIETSKGQLWIGSSLDAYNLGKKRFNIIWNLAAELPHLLDYEGKKTDTLLFGDIDDYKTPHDVEAFKSQLDLVVKSLSVGGSVFVHCIGGRGRTGMSVACIKMKLEGMSADEALAFAREVCRGGPETDIQVNFVKQF